MQSTEYPDLSLVIPAAYGIGRPLSDTPRVIVIHYTAGSERSTSAEDGAAYDQRRTDGTSTHYFVDQDSIIQCVYTWDRANAARYMGNRIGIQYELCGTSQTRAQWLDAASDATLTLAAKQVARDCYKYKIPVRKITSTQVAAGSHGICGHADITLAFPADAGDHMDPGPEFPWDVFIARVQTALTNIITQEDDMDAAQNAALGEAWAEAAAIRDGKSVSKAGNFAGGPHWLVEQVKMLINDVTTIKTTMPELDEDVIVARVVAQLIDKLPTAENIALALMRNIIANQQTTP